MTDAEAIELLRPAIEPGAARWADLGAGSGTFTRALAAILGPGAVVLALDRDPEALRALAHLADEVRPDVLVEPLEGDLRALAGVPRLAEKPLAGVLIANALHYLAEPHDALASAGGLVRPGGRVVIVEYERRQANPWVPHPLPFARLGEIAVRAGLTPPARVARRPSTYQGEMYVALAFVPGP